MRWLLNKRFEGCRLVRMSSGDWCLVRDLGPVKGGKGLKHHEVVMAFRFRLGAFRSLCDVLLPLLIRSAGSIRSTGLHAAIPPPPARVWPAKLLPAKLRAEESGSNHRAFK
jgi:hypothetical protein